MSGSELIINFKDDYYLGELVEEHLSFPVTIYAFKNITFFSEKSTTIDLSLLNPYTWFINFYIGNGLIDKPYIKFKNITFKNFLNYPSLLYVFYITPMTDSYQLYFENCKFIKVKNVIMNLFNCISSTEDEPQYIFNNCYFEYDIIYK